MTWRASRHAKYDCQDHLLWGPQRRRGLGDTQVRMALTETFRAIAEEVGVWIEELAGEEDHVHGVLEFPPRYSIARVMGLRQSISASRTFQQFPWRRRKYWPTALWEDGYAVRAVGDRVTTDLLRRSSRRHTEEQATNQPERF